MGLLRILIGLRDDPDLPSRWWHRLVKVLFVLAVIVVWTLLTVVSHGSPTLTASNVIILQTMREYLAANKQMPNAVPSFVAQPDGTVGIRTADGLLQPRLFLETQVFCSWDLRAHPEEAARFLSVNHPGLFPAVTVAQVKGWLEDAKADIEKGESCMDPARVLPKTADQLAASIVRFEVTGTARAMPWVRASGSWGCTSCRSWWSS